MTPELVIIETPDAFQLVLLLPCVLCLVPHLLYYHKCRSPAVWLVLPAVHFAEVALLDWLASYQVVLSPVLLPWLPGSDPQHHPYQRLRHCKFDPAAGGQGW